MNKYFMSNLISGAWSSVNQALGRYQLTAPQVFKIGESHEGVGSKKETEEVKIMTVI